jgi:hypothetical protein
MILFSSSFGSSGGLGITAIMPIDNVLSIASFTLMQILTLGMLSLGEGSDDLSMSTSGPGQSHGRGTSGAKQ